MKNETFSLSSSCKTGARVWALGPWRGVWAPGPWRGARALGERPARVRVLHELWPTMPALTSVGWRTSGDPECGLADCLQSSPRFQ